MNKSLEEKIEEIVWELHGQHQADFHMDETEDIIRDLKKTIEQLSSLFNSSLAQYKREILEKVIGEGDEGER